MRGSEPLRTSRHLLPPPPCHLCTNGIPEQVVDGEAGYLVREYDFETIAEKIVELLTDHDKLRRSGRAGRANILANYPPRLRIERILALLQDAGVEASSNCPVQPPVGAVS